MYSATVVPFAPGEVAHCTDLNDRGQVAGFVGENESAAGFVWKDGLREAVEAPNVGGAYVRAINNDGTVIGFTRSGSLDIGFKWSREGGLQKFMDGARELMPMAIADGDTVAGSLYDVPSREYVVGVWRPNSEFKILGSADGWEAAAINKSGTVVGNTTGAATHAFVVAPGRERKLLDAPVANAQAKGLDRYAEAIGTSINSGGSVAGWHAKSGCVWSPDGKRTDVGAWVYLRDLNDAGVAVGARSTGDAIAPSVAVVWDKAHGVRDLNSLVALDKTRLVDARAVNARGEILCSGVLNGSTFWFVLKPG